MAKEKRTEFLTTEQLADVLQCHKQTVLNRIKVGLPFEMWGGEYRFNLEDVKKYMKDKGKT